MVCHIEAVRLPRVAGICVRAVLLVPCSNKLPRLRLVEGANGSAESLLCQSFDGAPVQVVIGNEAQQKFLLLAAAGPGLVVLISLMRPDPGVMSLPVGVSILRHRPIVPDCVVQTGLQQGVQPSALGFHLC